MENVITRYFFKIWCKTTKRPSGVGFNAGVMTFASPEQAIEWREKHPEDFLPKTETFAKHLDCSRVFLVRSKVIDTIVECDSLNADSFKEDDSNDLEEVHALRAARIAYAKEFPYRDGEPDVGSIHENIRDLKKKFNRLNDEYNQLRRHHNQHCHCSEIY